MIKCRPYNPKAQGNVERSHRVLRRKIYYDLIKQKKTGVNWVKCLPKFIRCLNQEKREELGWQSALEIYFGSKANELKNEGKNHDKTIHLGKTVGRSTKDFRNEKRNTNQWRKKAREADLRMAKRMIKKDTRRFTNLVTKFLYVWVPNTVGEQLSRNNFEALQRQCNIKSSTANAKIEADIRT